MTVGGGADIDHLQEREKQVWRTDTIQHSAHTTQTQLDKTNENTDKRQQTHRHRNTDKHTDKTNKHADSIDKIEGSEQS